MDIHEARKVAAETAEELEQGTRLAQALLDHITMVGQAGTDDKRTNRSELACKTLAQHDMTEAIHLAKRVYKAGQANLAAFRELRNALDEVLGGFQDLIQGTDIQELFYE